MRASRSGALRNAFSSDNARCASSAPDRDALNGYLALYQDGDAGSLEQAASRLWRLSGSARADLATHLRVALSDRPLALPRPRDDALVEQARRKLGAGTRT